VGTMLRRTMSPPPQIFPKLRLIVLTVSQITVSKNCHPDSVNFSNFFCKYSKLRCYGGLYLRLLFFETIWGGGWGSIKLVTICKGSVIPVTVTAIV
jgi:hypothetical protein